MAEAEVGPVVGQLVEERFAHRSRYNPCHADNLLRKIAFRHRHTRHPKHMRIRPYTCLVMRAATTAAVLREEAELVAAATAAVAMEGEEVAATVRAEDQKAE